MRGTWKPLRLCTLARVSGGGTPGPDEENWNGDIPFVTPPDLRPVHGQECSTTDRRLTALGMQIGSSLAPKGSVLVSKRAPIGYVARIGMAAAFNQGCLAVVPDSEVVHGSFLTWALSVRSEEMNTLGRGTTFMEISAGDLRDLRILLPPLPEQRAIADYLDRETTKIDALVKKQEQLIGTLRERRDTAIAHFVIAGLNPDVTFRTSGHAWLGEVPAHWITMPLWSLFQRTKDVGHPDETMLSVFRDFGVVEKSSRDNINQTAENRDIYQLVHDGWLVTNRMKAWQGSVGISSYRGIVSGHYICFAPTHNEHNAYLNWLFRSRRYAAGYNLMSRGVRTGQAEIDNDEYRLLPVLLPPLEEQRAIADCLEQQTANIDLLISKAERFIELAKERRSALITAAVTGQIDVRGEPRAQEEEQTETEPV